MKYLVQPKLLPLLKEKGMTQVQLSELTGIAQGTISRFDKNGLHKAEHLVLISNALNLSIEDLFIIKELEE